MNKSIRNKVLLVSFSGVVAMEAILFYVGTTLV